MQTWQYLGLAAAFLAGAVAVGWYGTADRDRSERMALGQKLYSEHCAACHGADLQGQPNWQVPLPNGRMPAPPHDESGHTWHHPDQELFTITKHGLAAVVPDYESDMPAFEGILSDEEIAAVLAYIKNTWPKREREYQAARSEQASSAGEN